jgi:hypothetical protein
LWKIYAEAEKEKTDKIIENNYFIDLLCGGKVIKKT